jgi:hypothetical protein
MGSALENALFRHCVATLFLAMSRAIPIGAGRFNRYRLRQFVWLGGNRPAIP